MHGLPRHFCHAEVQAFARDYGLREGKGGEERPGHCRRTARGADRFGAYSAALQARASRAAQHYANAHDAAYRAYARLETYKAMVESEEALTHAMALPVHAPEPTGIDRQADDPRAYRMKFIWQRLSAVALKRPEAQQQPEVEALGPLGAGGVRGACEPHAGEGDATAAGGGDGDGLSVT